MSLRAIYFHAPGLRPNSAKIKAGFFLPHILGLHSCIVALMHNERCLYSSEGSLLRKKKQSSFVNRAYPWWLLLAFTDISPKKILKNLKQTFQATASC